jgi:hypothetical protein
MLHDIGFNSGFWATISTAQATKAKIDKWGYIEVENVCIKHQSENIILSEVSLAQKTKNRMFSFICGH